MPAKIVSKRTVRIRRKAKPRRRTYFSEVIPIRDFRNRMQRFQGATRNLRKRPGLGAAMAGGVGVVLAMLVGVGETALGGVAAYTAYRFAKRKRH